MHNRVWKTFLIVVIAGGFCVVGAQQTPPLKKAAGPVGYDPYTYTGKWYGYVTDSKDFRQGYKATADQIRTSIAAGATYVLYNPHAGRLGLYPPEKVAPFVGQRVFVAGSIVSTVYGTGPTAASEVSSNGGFADPERFSMTTIRVSSVAVTDLADAYDPIVEKAPGAAR